MQKIGGTIGSVSSRCLHLDNVVPPVVQVISLDAMDTILTLREPAPTVYARFARHHGIEVDDTKIQSAFVSTMKRFSKETPCFAHGKGGAEEWWNSVITGTIEKASSNDIEPSKSEVLAKELFAYYTDADAWMLVDPEIKTALGRIRRKGIPLAVISNFDYRLKGLLQEFDLLPLLDMVVLSGELGIEKPNPQIFDVVVRHFHLDSPNHLLHIGDHKTKDFEGAKRFGARSILFDPYDQSPDVPRHDRILKFEELKIY